MGLFSFLFRSRHAAANEPDSNRSASKESNWIPDPARKLIIYIGWPLENPVEWRSVGKYDRQHLELDGALINPSGVQSRMLVYPNGEVVSGTNMFLPLPPVVKFLEPTGGPTEPLSLDAAQISLGKAVCQVTHDRFHRGPDGKRYYATTLRNISPQPIRIRRFAGFRPSGRKFMLSTVTGGYFSGEQFIAWYATPSNGWILPGGQAADESNYGSGRGMWAYFGETQDGNHFIAATPMPR